MKAHGVSPKCACVSKAIEGKNCSAADFGSYVLSVVGIASVASLPV